MRALLGDAAAEGANAETPGATAAAAANRAREDAESFIGLLIYFRPDGSGTLPLYCVVVAGTEPQVQQRWQPIFEVEDLRPVSAVIVDDGQTFNKACLPSSLAIFLATAESATTTCSYVASLADCAARRHILLFRDRRRNLLQGEAVPLKPRTVA